VNIFFLTKWCHGHSLFPVVYYFGAICVLVAYTNLVLYRLVKYCANIPHFRVHLIHLHNEHFLSHPFNQFPFVTNVSFLTFYLICTKCENIYRNYVYQHTKQPFQIFLWDLQATLEATLLTVKYRLYRWSVTGKRGVTVKVAKIETLTQRVRLYPTEEIIRGPVGDR